MEASDNRWFHIQKQRKHAQRPDQTTKLRFQRHKKRDYLRRRQDSLRKFGEDENEITEHDVVFENDVIDEWVVLPERIVVPKATLWSRLKRWLF